MKVLLADAGMPFDLQTPYLQPLGGSETSIILLSKGLSELGHQVVILSNNQFNAKQDGNRLIDSINNFDAYAEVADIIILNRFLPKNIQELVKNNRVFFYTHDAYDQRNIQWLIQENAEKHFEKIFCVSNWQKNSFVKYFDCDKNCFEVLGNPIDYSLYYGYTKRNENKLIFASIPYKGLEFLPDLFNDICIKSKRDNLEFHIFSSFQLYGQDKQDEQYIDTYRKLDNINNVFLHKPVSMKDLAYEFSSSSLLIHPCTYHETFGRVFIESMAAGCIPVTVNNGANKEVIQDKGMVVDYPNIENIECYEKYVENVCDLLEKDLYGMRIKGKKYTKKWDYINIARKVDAYIRR